MTTVTNLGFPRIGAKRELKLALEAFWRGESTAARLQDTAAELRERHWQLQREAGIDIVPPATISRCTTTCSIPPSLFGAIPARYRALADRRAAEPATSRWRAACSATASTCTRWR